MSFGEKGETAEQATQAYTVEVPEGEGTSLLRILVAATNPRLH